LRLAFTKAAAALALLCLFTSQVSAKPPTLELNNTAEIPAEVPAGQPVTFNVTYKQDAGDPPTSLKLVVITPSGEVSVPALPPGGDPVAGVTVTWPFTPKEAGTYKYHFEATSSTGGFARYPANAADDLQLVSFSILNKYIVLMVGLVIALAFLPFIVYVASRSINKRGAPATAARVALLIGVIASYALFLYLFHAVYGVLQLALGGVAAVALLIALFTRK
jgi:hypothetical protein